MWVVKSSVTTYPGQDWVSPQARIGVPLARPPPSQCISKDKIQKGVVGMYAEDIFST